MGIECNYHVATNDSLIRVEIAIKEYERSKIPTTDFWLSHSSSRLNNKHVCDGPVKRQFAFELFGRHATLSNRRNVLLGRSQARLRLIRSRGWKIIPILIANWVAVPTYEEK